MWVKMSIVAILLSRLISPWAPHRPTMKQAEFLLTAKREAMYGGAAGGGKSDALLMGALQFVDVPHYNALILRRTYADLSLPGALLDRAAEWLGPTSARWVDKTKTWTFPSGATISFGYLDTERDKYRYQSSEFQFIGFDELTQFTETQYRYLFSRLRRLKGQDVPLRMRAASNPGGVGHDWVKRRFIDCAPQKDRVFIPAKLDDNPHLDREEYLESLKELDPVTRRQLLDGDWNARPPGGKFRREWFRIVDAAPNHLTKVRYWDLAATEPAPGKDPDWTAGVLMGKSPEGEFVILDVRRAQLRPKGVEDLIKQTAQLDGRETRVVMEQEPGSSGVNTIDHYARRVLAGWDFHGEKTTGAKEIRANPLSAQAEARNVLLLNGPWVSEFLDEAEAFGTGGHDDQVDAGSGAFKALTDEVGFFDFGDDVRPD